MGSELYLDFSLYVCSSMQPYEAKVYDAGHIPDHSGSPWFAFLV